MRKEEVMDRPRVICHMLMSLDGKIDGRYFALPETRPGLRKYGELRTFYGCPATIYGTTTAAEGYSDGYVYVSDLPERSAEQISRVYVGDSGAENYIIAMDPEGTLKWSGKFVEKKGRPKAHVIEALTERASASYIAYLKSLGISYIIAGEKQIDCELLLRRLKEHFGIESVLLAGGGITNWSFVSRGLVDELSVVLVPAADGDIAAASLFEARKLAPSIPKAFALKAVEVIENDTLWLRYILK